MATASSTIAPRRKLALLIGNNKYEQKENLLLHCVNDADDLTVELEKINFHVITKHNLTKKDMHTAIKQFKDLVKDGDLVVFFFSGHGRHVNGANYMIPIDDKEITTNEDVVDNAINLDILLERFSDKNSSYATIFILDCCRVYRPDSVPKSKGEDLFTERK
jgi:uncharacterized caspase-like protein